MYRHLNGRTYYINAAAVVILPITDFNCHFFDSVITLSHNHNRMLLNTEGRGGNDHNSDCRNVSEHENLARTVNKWL